MAVLPDKVDGYRSFLGGMNQGVSPDRVAATQTVKNISISLKRDTITPRPGKISLELKFSKELEQKASLGAFSYRDNFLKGRVQHRGKYQTSFGEYLVMVVNGIVYLVDVVSCQVKMITIEGFSPTCDWRRVRINGTQAGKYYVLFDWPNSVVVIEDFEARRADPQNEEVPRSFIGTFVHNRLFVGNSGVEFGASDPISPSNPLAPITFKESIVSNNNPSPPYPEQFFSVSYIEQLSNITAMGFLRQADGASPLGFGPLFVSSKEALHLFRVDEPRSSWESIQFGSVLIYNYGIVGPQAFTNIGADLFYRSFDGRIYSTGTIVKDQRSWGINDISREIEDSLVSTNTDLLQHSSMAYFDNRLFTTLRPYVFEAKDLFGNPIEDYVFDGLGVIEFNNVTGVTRGGSSSPSWASVYPGAYLGVLEVSNKLIAVEKDCETGFNSLVQISEKAPKDYQNSYPKTIKSRFYTKELEFESPIQDKTLDYVYMKVRNIVGKFQAEIFYRVDPDADWSLLGNICYDNESPLCRPSAIQNEFICRNTEEDASFKSIQFRVDLQGQDYEIASFLAFASLSSDFQPERSYDVEASQFEGFSELGDLELCQ